MRLCLRDELPAVPGRSYWRVVFDFVAFPTSECRGVDGRSAARHGCSKPIATTAHCCWSDSILTAVGAPPT